MRAPQHGDLAALRIARNSRPRGFSAKRLLAVVGLGLGAVGAVALLWPAGQIENAGAHHGAKSPGVLTIGPPPQPDAGLDASGYLAARRRARIASPMVGRVQSLAFRVGDRVAKGDLMAQLDDAPARARWRKARADVEAARLALRESSIRSDEARQEWARQAKLGARGVVGAAALETARVELEARRAHLATRRLGVEVAVRDAEVWRLEVERHKIRAPFDGTVVARNAEEGEVVGPLSKRGRFAREGIATLVDRASLEVEVEVNEAQIDRVRPDQPAVVVLDAYPGEDFAARVSEIEPAADRQRASFRVWLRLDEDDPRMRPEMGTRVRLGPRTHEASR